MKIVFSGSEYISNNEQLLAFDNTVMPPPLFQYFEENSDEILHLQSICFTVQDILFLIDLIGRNIQIFSDLPKYIFLIKHIKE